MNMGIIAALVSSFFGGVANMLMKKVSVRYDDNNLALVYQYIGMTIAALGLGALRALFSHTAYIPQLSPLHWGGLLLISIAGYIGIQLLFTAYDHINGGVALVIANLATFLMYFINLLLYPGQENFSLPKIILAVIFFIIIALFLLDQPSATTDQTHKKFQINTHMLYALGTAICWSIFFVGNSWYIKSGLVSPVQSGMLTESLILVVASIYYIFHHPKTGLTTIRNTMQKSEIGVFLGIGFFNVLSVYLLYYGYQTNSANMINVIKLFAIPFAAVACWIFLKDKLTQKQLYLLILGVASMIGFMIV